MKTSTKEQVISDLAQGFPGLRIVVTEESGSPSIHIGLFPAASDETKSDAIVQYLATKGHKVENNGNDYCLIVNPEHYHTVAEWLLCDGVGRLYVEQERDHHRLRVWVDKGYGEARYYDCTNTVLGRKALAAWDQAGRPSLNRDVPPTIWECVEGDWQKVEGDG